MKNTKMVIFGLMLFIVMVGVTLSVSFSFNKYGETVELHFYTNGGTELENTFYTYGKDSLFEKLPVPKKQGYVFKGWFLDQTLETKLRQTPMPNFSDHTIIHLYAKWGLPEEKEEFINPIVVLILLISTLILIVASQISKKIKEIKAIEE